ncbi:MAG: C4-type zinc ribbon domain-containing protein [Dehalococcoidia bacterium]|nr:C4-type zinc ribbon domain-containing protein [Dehalococcoidia bacterium]
MTLARTLYDLQQIDLNIQKEQETLDDIDRQLGESEALSQARAELSAEKKHLAESEKQQKDLEYEIDDLRSSIKKLNDKLYGGKEKNPKELVNLEKEQEIFKAKLRQKEDDLLDLMAEIESVQDKIKIQSERLGNLEEEWRQEQKELTQRQAKVKSRLSELGRTRQTLASDIAKQTLELYEGIRVRKGQAVAKIEQGRCQGCRLNLAVNELQRARAGDLIQCSSCGRILCLS